MRSLAAHCAQGTYDVIAVSEIAPGEALSFATRFDLQWAYRGSQALFWGAQLEHARCSELYLPLRLTRPFARRAFLRVDADRGKHPLTLGITQLSASRTMRAAELRFLRAELRKAQPQALLFVSCDDPAFSFAAGEWSEFAASGSLRCVTRGLHCREFASADVGLEALTCILQA